MRSVIGLSENRNITDAVREATASITSVPSCLLVMCGYKDLPEAVRLIHEKYPDSQMIGTGGTCYSGTHYSDRDLIITAMMDVTASAGVITKLSSAPVEDIAGFERSVGSVSPGHDNTVCIEYCTNDEERLVTTLNTVLADRGISLAGGTVFGYPEGSKGTVGVNGEMYEDACAYMIIKNNSGKARVYSETIYGKNSETSHIATKVNLAKKELIELDHKPAAEVYGDELGIPRNKIVDSVLNHPLGRIVGNDVFISSMYAVGDNGSLINYKRINENDTINILKLLDYREINEETRKRIKEDFTSVSLIVSVNCIYRYILFKQEDYFDRLLSDMALLGNHTGCIGGGEQCNNQHVNQTMVCAVFE